ncbi:MAG TPA: hypothetical protein PKC47_12555, partial [Petrimonas sp.]|nr:hypothetical protein [Petrimonas sp.]
TFAWSTPMGNNLQVHKSISFSENNQFHKIISGDIYRDAIEMLTTAVNNRTIERNYFKLYCELLDGSLSDEEFDALINQNEEDYIVSENIEPEPSQVSLALKLSKRIKDVKSINDLASLFSFNSKSIEQLAIE